MNPCLAWRKTGVFLRSVGCHYWHPVRLSFQKVNVFVNGRSAQITNSCQFADVKVSALVCGVVPKESRRKVIHGNLRPPDLLPLFPCVCHPRPHTGADHSQFQLTECGLFEAEYRLHTSFCISWDGLSIWMAPAQQLQKTKFVLPFLNNNLLLRESWISTCIQRTGRLMSIKEKWYSRCVSNPCAA